MSQEAATERVTAAMAKGTARGTDPEKGTDRADPEMGMVREPETGTDLGPGLDPETVPADPVTGMVRAMDRDPETGMAVVAEAIPNSSVVKPRRRSHLRNKNKPQLAT